MANTLIKNVLCQEDTLDPDGFNRNQVKVLSCSLIVYYSDCVKKLYVSVPMYNITVGINPKLHAIWSYKEQWYKEPALIFWKKIKNQH